MENFIYNSIAVCTAELATLPLDTIKTHMQTSLPTKYTPFQSIRIIYKNNGIFGFYNSASFSIMRQIVNTSTKFALYPVLIHQYEKSQNTILHKKFINNYINDEIDNRINNSIHYALNTSKLIGLGIFCSLLSSPFEVIKIRQQSQSYVKQSSFKILYDVYQQNGLMGYYKGFRQNILRQVILSTVQIPTYHKLNHEMLKPHIDNLFLRTFTSSVATTVLVSLIIHPIDMAKVKIMNENKTNTSTFYQIRYVLQKSNITTLYNGFTVNVFRSMPHFLIVTTVYEYLKKRN